MFTALVDSVNHHLASGHDDGPSLLRDVARVYVRAQRQAVARCGPHSTARCHVLGELARGGPLRLTALAARLDADKSWTSRTVTAMAAEGLLSAGRTEGDGRVVQVALTPAGRACWERIDAAIRRHAGAVFERLSAAEQQEVRRGLASLQRALATPTCAPGAPRQPAGEPAPRTPRRRRSTPSRPTTAR
jgi:DNA-binding MarR family transcriptional regulator